MTLSGWWSMNGAWVYEILWAVVSVVGLVIALRRRRQYGRAGWFAVAAFTVMLLAGVYPLYVLITNELSRRGHEWAKAGQEWFAVVWYTRHALHVLGFALLTAAVFTGRQPVHQHDPDDIP